MQKLTALSVIVLIFTVVEGCVYRDNECAPYTVMEKHADYEIRSYPSLTWATTTEEDQLARVARYKAFMRLFEYISGKNDRSQTINMTVPVRMKMTPHGEKMIHEMSFMVPAELAQNPPAPENKLITISKEDPKIYAVRMFSGYVWRQATWDKEAENLKNSVKEDETIDSSEFYQVGYDAPFEIFDRRNEIWMVKKQGEELNTV
ncbi:heme-binding protein 1 [Trichonephila clavipes]|nr:heme-binding protein 1 [Trichonephila clavipes]